MHDCDICYNSYININILNCCIGKRMCNSCKEKYACSTCPFCRQHMKPAIIIVNKNIPYKGHGKIILTMMNYNVIRIYV